jgi:glycosyltransferase involved in cell wall biosynthesis
LPAVSVAIPNYNYARFMPARLASVFQQTHPVHEIVVLDDCSSDDSLDMIPQIAREWNRKLTLLSSEANSGSVFAQWRKAAELATGEYLWIAEADDLTDPEFLGAVVGAMQADPAICLGFSDSRTINYDGSPLWDSYKDYYEHDGRGALATSATFDGDDFVRRHLAVRNLILNVSAVVWRREALLRALDACQEELKTFRMAGDWRLYLEVLTAPGARIAYIADPLNVHRRHAESVTHALKADKHVAEIAQCHALGAERLKLPARVRSLQTKYRQSVEDQLKAAPTDKAG